MLTDRFLGEGTLLFYALYESLDVNHFKGEVTFLKNFETAFTQNIGDTVCFSEMFANCRIFVFSNALEKAVG